MADDRVKMFEHGEAKSKRLTALITPTAWEALQRLQADLGYPSMGETVEQLIREKAGLQTLSTAIPK